MIILILYPQCGDFFLKKAIREQHKRFLASAEARARSTILAQKGAHKTGAKSPDCKILGPVESLSP